MDKFNHLLSKHGLLKAFNIAKKVKKSEVNKLKLELKKVCKDNKELNQRLEQMIMIQVKSSLQKEQIPGLIINNSNVEKSIDPFFNIPTKTKEKIISCTFIINQLLKNEKINNNSLLILIQILLYQNGITNDDIKKFNKNYNLNSLDDSTYLNEDDIDTDGEEDDDDDQDN